MWMILSQATGAGKLRNPRGRQPGCAGHGGRWRAAVLGR